MGVHMHIIGVPTKFVSDVPKCVHVEGQPITRPQIRHSNACLKFKKGEFLGATNSSVAMYMHWHAYDTLMRVIGVLMSVNSSHILPRNFLSDVPKGVHVEGHPNMSQTKFVSNMLKCVHVEDELNMNDIFNSLF